MKVIIIGAGVIGVTSAYFLAKAGCEVTVLDRRSAVALETSFANAGQISPGYSSPWAAPGIPLKAMKWMLSKHSPLVLRPQVDVNQWRWMISLLANCTAEAYQRNKSRMVRVAEYSRDVLSELRAEHQLDFAHGTSGTLQVFRSEAQLNGMLKDVQVLQQFGVPHEVLTPEGCAVAEPGLARVRDKIVGGLRLPDDQTGDCRRFTAGLAKVAADMGVTFRFGVEVYELMVSHGQIAGLDTSEGDLFAHSYLLAAGPHSAALAQQAEIRLPIYPVKGYSIDVPIADADSAPRSTLMDETYKVAITRLGDKVRVGGTAEVSGYGGKLHRSRMNTLVHSFTDLFPDAGTPDPDSLWRGMRPMTPDSTPIIGPTRYPNLFLNTGHGTLGWTMSCGSAKVLSHLMLGDPTEIEAGDLGVSRYAVVSARKSMPNRSRGSSGSARRSRFS